MLLLVFGPLLAAVVDEHINEPPVTPLRGAAAASYLTSTWRATPDPMTRVRCGTDACEVWLRPYEESGLHGAYVALTMDTFLVSGALGMTTISHWTTHLQTRAGTITAACSTTQAQRLDQGPSMTKAVLERWCPTFFVPSGA